MPSGNIFIYGRKKNLILDNRLKACADNVTGKGTAVDVGTDHAYLATYLVKNKLCEKVIACDINEGPLNAAKQTTVKYCVSDNVEIVLSDGLKNVSCDGVSDVVVAGMGGELIAKILSDSNWNFENINLVLQPMTKVHFLRGWFYENGFEIKSETIASDDRFLYTIMCVAFCGETRKISDFETVVGKVDNKTSEEKKYLAREKSRLDKIISGLCDSGNNEDRVKNLVSVRDKLMEML